MFAKSYTASLLLLSTLFVGEVFGQEETLYRFFDSADNCGYRNRHAEIIIPPGKYSMCFTDSSKHFAAVFSEKNGLIGIDANGKRLFQIFSYDNGPDPLSDGLFRIIINEKIGFANAKGEIIIDPEYDCAYAFQNGMAKVSYTCQSKTSGEHSIWKSKKWIYIDTLGHVVK